MKKPAILLLTAATISIIGCFSISKKWFSKEPLCYEESGEEDEEKEEGEGGEENEQQSGAAKQLNGWFQAKAFPNPENLTVKYQNAWQQHLEIKKRTEDNTSSRTGSSSNWTQLGYCIDENGNRIAGRIVCLAIDPGNTSNLWAGSAGGGIWRSINGGTNWSPVQTNLNVLGVSSIIVDPTNSNIIYAGTGEVYHTEADVMGFNVWKARGTYGIGIIKTTDGGGSWSQVMPKISSDLFAIQSMAFRPGLSTTIYACATDGLYRSTNSGVAWSKIYTGDNVRDIAINPTSTNEIVISVGNMTNPVKGIFRTTTGNNASPTWSQISAGLPASFEGYMVLDNVGSGNLVASIGRSSSTANSNREVYRSVDFGLNWSVVGTGTTSANTTNHCSYQFWFAHTVAINPFDTDSLFFGGVGLYRYSISNVNRTTVNGLHADNHDIEFDPVRRGTIYICTDGGIYKTTNGGVSFSVINNGLNATQFYASLGVSRQDATVMIGGLQDNGQVLYNGTNWVKTENNGWGGGDGTSCAVHPTNDNIILASRDAKQVFRTSNGGTSGGAVTAYWGFTGDSRTAFVAPVAFAPSNGNVAYLASDNIHISANAGASFTNNTLGATPPYPATTPNAFIEQRHKTAIALAVSPLNSSKLYVSTSPFAQYDNDVNDIYVNGNPNLLKTTTPATTPYASIKGALPNRFVTDIAISKNSDDSVYVVLGGFGASHIYLTPDGGTTWLSRGGAGLPDVPFNAVLIDPVHQSTIYVGTDFGVYVSPDKGATWSSYNIGFYDVTLVMDLQLDANNKLIAATHGKGVFRSDLYDYSILPVTLLDFNGTGAAGYNRLQWKVSQELGLTGYELERSTDGTSFTRVATVQAQNHTDETSYTHNDNTSLFETYYRLKIINLDGSFTYSSVVFIRKSGVKSEFTVLGNPFTDHIVLKYQLSKDQRITARLFTSAGALIRREEYAATAGTGIYTITGFKPLNPGVYLLKIESGSEMQTIKLIKN